MAIIYIGMKHSIIDLCKTSILVWGAVLIYLGMLIYNMQGTLMCICAAYDELGSNDIVTDPVEL